MALEKARSTGWTFIVIAAIALVWATLSFYIPGMDTDPTHNHGQGHMCLGVFVPLMIIGLIFVVGGTVSSRESKLPIVRSYLLLFVGTGLVCGGSLFLIFEHYSLTAVPPPTRFEYSAVPTKWLKIDIPAGNSFSLHGYRGHEVMVKTCLSDTVYVLDGDYGFDSTPDGSKGRLLDDFPPQTDCLYIRSLRLETVGVNLYLKPLDK